jgi:polyisoprenoid-binding protein YceI
MKKIIILTVLYLLFSSLSNAQVQIYNLDTQNSQIGWVGKKLTGKHHGTIKIKSGKLHFDHQKIVDGEFIIDMTSIQVLDLKDPQKKQKLINHLKSDDFFSVEKFPEGRFKITSTQIKSHKKLEVTGDLTLKGITHPVVIPVAMIHEFSQLKAKGKLIIDRTQWDIRYGSGKFFKGLGDKLVSDDIELELDLVARPNDAKIL